jgi:hypothetical protein
MRHADRWRTWLLAGLAVAGASRTEAAEVTLNADLLSAYVWRGITFNDGLVLQPSLDVGSLKLGGVSLALNVWGSFNVEGWDGRTQKGQFSEVDLNLTVELPAGFSAGYTEYIFAVGGSVEFQPPPEPSTRELMLSWSRDLAVTPSVSLYYDVEQIKDLFVLLSLAKEMPVAKKLALGLEAQAGWAGDRFARYYEGAHGGLYHYGLIAKLSFSPSDERRLSATVGYVSGFDASVLPRQDARFFGGVSLSLGL